MKDIYLVICKECSRPFFATHKRTKFCPHVEEGKESKCAHRYRQRRYRQKVKSTQ